MNAVYWLKRVFWLQMELGVMGMHLRAHTSINKNLRCFSLSNVFTVKLNSTSTPQKWITWFPFCIFLHNRDLKEETENLTEAQRQMLSSVFLTNFRQHSLFCMNSFGPTYHFKSIFLMHTHSLFMHSYMWPRALSRDMSYWGFVAEALRAHLWLCVS